MNPIVRMQVWQGLLSMERLARYFAELHRKYYRRHFWFNVILTVSSTSLLGSFALQFESPLFQSVLSVAIGVIAVIYLVQNPSKQVAMLHVINTQMNRYCREYDELWVNYELFQINDDEAFARSQSLVSRVDTLADQFDLPADEDLNEKAAFQAYRIVLSRYSHAT